MLAINSLPNNEIIDLSKLRAHAEANIKSDPNDEICLLKSRIQGEKTIKC